MNACWTFDVGKMRCCCAVFDSGIHNMVPLEVIDEDECAVAIMIAGMPDVDTVSSIRFVPGQQAT